MYKERKKNSDTWYVTRTGLESKRKRVPLQCLTTLIVCRTLHALYFNVLPILYVGNENTQKKNTQTPYQSHSCIELSFTNIQFYLDFRQNTINNIFYIVFLSSIQKEINVNWNVLVLCTSFLTINFYVNSLDLKMKLNSISSILFSFWTSFGVLFEMVNEAINTSESLRLIHWTETKWMRNVNIEKNNRLTK